MAMIGKIRRMHLRDGKSVREIVRLTSLARNTVRTVFAPAGYQPVEAAARAAAARHRPSYRPFGQILDKYGESASGLDVSL